MRALVVQEHPIEVAPDALPADRRGPVQRVLLVVLLRLRRQVAQLVRVRAVGRVLLPVAEVAGANSSSAASAARTATSASLSLPV